MATTTQPINLASTHLIHLEDFVAVHHTIIYLISHAVMAGTVHEDSSTDVWDSSTDVSGDEDVAGIIVPFVK